MMDELFMMYASRNPLAWRWVQ